MNDNPDIELDSELLSMHRNTASNNNTGEVHRRYSEKVIEYVEMLERFRKEPQAVIFRENVGFKVSAERLELLSSEYEKVPANY